MTDDQIKHMVQRFLMWKLPENFRPDNHIEFDGSKCHQNHWPVGTNLFDYTQAEAMVRHMVTDLIAASEPVLDAPKIQRAVTVEDLAKHLHDEEYELNSDFGSQSTWPEHPDDDGYRGGNGYVRIAPSDVQARCREAAARIWTLLRMDSLIAASEPVPTASKCTGGKFSGDGEPMDCGWPDCIGVCDPDAERIIKGLQECGWTVEPHREPVLDAEVAEQVDHLIGLMVGGCTCGVKTPVSIHHTADCRYRVVSDAISLLERLATENARLIAERSALPVFGKFLDQLDAERAAWVWLEPIIDAEKAAVGEMRLLIETPKVGVDGGATVLYRDHTPVAATVIFRDAMNHSRLIVWRRAILDTPVAPRADEVVDLQAKLAVAELHAEYLIKSHARTQAELDALTKGVAAVWTEFGNLEVEPYRTDFYKCKVLVRALLDQHLPPAATDGGV